MIEKKAKEKKALKKSRIQDIPTLERHISNQSDNIKCVFRLRGKEREEKMEKVGRSKEIRSPSM